jgi:hypothetical protein
MVDHLDLPDRYCRWFCPEAVIQVSRVSPSTVHRFVGSVGCRSLSEYAFISAFRTHCELRELVHDARRDHGRVVAGVWIGGRGVVDHRVLAAASPSQDVSLAAASIHGFRVSHPGSLLKVQPRPTSATPVIIGGTVVSCGLRSRLAGAALCRPPHSRYACHYISGPQLGRPWCVRARMMEA